MTNLKEITLFVTIFNCFIYYLENTNKLTENKLDSGYKKSYANFYGVNDREISSNNLRRV